MPALPGTPTTSAADLHALFSKALRPSIVEVHVDPTNLDRLFLIHFEDRESLCLRVPAVELSAILHTLSDTIARSMN